MPYPLRSAVLVAAYMVVLSMFAACTPARSSISAKLAQERAHRQYWEGAWGKDTIRIFFHPDNDSPLKYATMQMPNKEIWLLRDDITQYHALNKNNQRIGTLHVTGVDSLFWSLEEYERFEHLFSTPLVLEAGEAYPKIYFRAIYFDSLQHGTK